MMRTEKSFPSTVFTVSETPSSATEPFAAMNRESGAGAQGELRPLRAVLAAQHFGDPVDMSADDMAPKLLADLQRALEIDPHARPPGANGRHLQRLGGGIDGKPG